MRLVDPSVSSKSVVARRRFGRPKDADAFRLDVAGFHCATGAATDRTHVVLGASNLALKPDRRGRTLYRLGRTGGLLVDAGYSVCPIAANARSSSPGLVVWVCDDETTADEEWSLGEIGSPGICIGTCVDLSNWTWTDPADFPDERDFERGLLALVSDIIEASDGL